MKTIRMTFVNKDHLVEVVETVTLKKEIKSLTFGGRMVAVKKVLEKASIDTRGALVEWEVEGLPEGYLDLPKARRK